ncbi:MAG TPA: CDP-diacylglycerol--glycerol-3-phosphate 3-phosphatidyltransferase [Gaiellales bacterium]
MIRRSEGMLTALSSVRVLAVPVVMGLVLANRGGHVDDAAAVLFAVAAVTDTLDGYLARRWGLESTLGSFIDTTADKLLTSGTLVALVSVGRASAWIATVIIGRELLIMGLRGLIAADGTVMKPSIWGKLKTNTQFVAILLAIVHLHIDIGPLRLDEVAMLAAAAITVASAVEYLVRFSGSLTGAASRTEP